LILYLFIQRPQGRSDFASDNHTRAQWRESRLLWE